MGGGWNRPTIQDGGTQNERAGKRTLVHGFIAGTLVVCAAIGVWCFLKDNAQSENEPVQKKTTIACHKPSAAPIEAKAPTRNVRDALPRLRPKKVDEEWERMKEQPRGTNLAERVGIPEPKVETEEEIVKKRRIFNNEVEQLLSMVTPSDPTIPVPPIPVSPEGDTLSPATISRGVDNVIRPDEDDDVESLQRKIDVTDMKEEYRNLAAQEGMTFAEYLNALRDQRNEDAKFYAEACQLDLDTYHDEKISNASYLDFRKQINEKLAERGLPPLPENESEGDEAADGSAEDTANAGGNTKKGEAKESEEP